MNIKLKLSLVFLIFSAVSLLVNLINLRRKNRRYQLPFPVVAGVFGIAASFALTIYRYRILDYVNSIPLESPDQLEPNRFIYSIEPLINTDLALFNLAIILGFAAVKIASCIFAMIYKAKEPEEVEETIGTFYSFDPINTVWYLNDEWVNFRTLSKAIAAIVTLISAVYLTLTCYFGQEHPIWMFIFPALPQIVVLEISNFFNGFTKDEFEHKVVGKDSLAQRMNNFHKLRDLYEALFPNELLAANTNNQPLRRDSGNDIVDELVNSPEPEMRITGEFFSNQEENSFDPDSLIASVKLVENKNVVFFNPFYRDCGDYIALPLINTLLNSGNCLVVLGRNSVVDDVELWLKEIIKEYTKMESMWRIKVLSHTEPECEIGFLKSSALYDLNILKNNYEFLEDVRFIIFIEPSLIINTAQISLSMLAQQIKKDGNTVNFCVFDKPTDGLVDTLSHIMKDEIVEVVAPPLPVGSYTAMAWNADGDYLRQTLFDKQTKFLGNGTELAAVAIKNQIPNVTWFSESKAPVRDIKWIAAQYYPTLCKYMNIKSQQKSIHDKILFESNLWSAKREKDSFIVAEDEFDNFFLTLRAFLSRGTQQTFVNVLSENYLLRDYMRCNTRMFLSNPNSIPSLVSDYSKTERNLIIKLILAMSVNELHEDDIRKELQLINIKTDNVLRTVSELIKKYTLADEKIINIRSVDSDIGEIDADTYYSVSKEAFEKFFSNSLKTAYYIVEEEKEQIEYLDSRLYGHITQTVLPGQFITYDGKYYQVKFISSESGVILRRASDLYSGREYYRQLRKYTIESVNDILECQTFSDIEIAVLQCDFSVKTDGYLQLNSNNDLRSAKVVKFGLEEEIDSFSRSFKNKSVLRIKLPDTKDRTRFTLSILLSELFKTVYPNSWQYLAVLSAVPEDIDGMLNYMIYESDLSIDDEYIYIVEDSYIDLGLLSSVEKNLFRFFEIIADFLDWHEDKMREREREDPIPSGLSEVVEDENAQQKKSLISRLVKRVSALFRRKKDDDEDDGNKDPKKVEFNDGIVASEQPESQKEAVDKANEETLETTEETAEAAEATTEETAEETAEAAEATTEETAEETAEAAEATTEETAEETAEAAEATTEETAEETAEAAEEATEETAEETAEAAEEATEETAEETAEAAEEATEETAEETAEAAEATTEETAEETAEAAEEATEETAEETAEAAGEANTVADLAVGKEGAVINVSVDSHETVNRTDIELEEQEETSDELESIKETDSEVNSDETSKTENASERFTDEDYVPTDDVPELAAVDGTDIFEKDGLFGDYPFADQFEKAGILPIKPTRYQKECYLKFGFTEIDERLKIDELERYFNVHGWTDNSLTKARKRKMLAEHLLDFNAENHCDFCGLPLTGVCYDRLNDGRIRCTDCSANTISSVDELTELFYSVLEMMDTIFSVTYKKPITIEMADANTVAQRSGVLFAPSKDYTARVLGFARYSRGQYSILMENGSPRLAAIDTMVHEMTHIWQYCNWDRKQIEKDYSMPNKLCHESDYCNKLVQDILYEGMAVWASIQYLYQIGETYYAAQQERIAELRKDVYGVGFRLYREKYPFVTDSTFPKYTPFLEFPTIDASKVIRIVADACTSETQSC